MREMIQIGRDRLRYVATIPLVPQPQEGMMPDPWAPMSLKNIPYGYVAVSVEEAAEYWGVSRSAAYQRLRGHLRESELVMRNGTYCSLKFICILAGSIYRSYPVKR